MLARQHEAGEQVPGMGAFRVDEARQRAPGDVEQIVDGAAQDAGLAGDGEPFDDLG